jgi:hypothetical protein
MILVTCTISSFVVEKASQRIALQENTQPDAVEEEPEEKIMISLAYPETVNYLTDLALLIKPPKSKAPIYALHVRDEQDDSENKQALGKKMMENVIKHAAATDSTVVPINRFDLNISNGIIFTIKEHKITDLIIGMHKVAHAGNGPYARNRFYLQSRPARKYPEACSGGGAAQSRVRGRFPALV